MIVINSSTSLTFIISSLALLKFRILRNLVSIFCMKFKFPILVMKGNVNWEKIKRDTLRAPIGEIEDSLWVPTTQRPCVL